MILAESILFICLISTIGLLLFRVFNLMTQGQLYGDYKLWISFIVQGSHVLLWVLAFICNVSLLTKFNNNIYMLTLWLFYLSFLLWLAEVFILFVPLLLPKKAANGGLR